MKYLIVGLGNVGNEYTHTRHNIGFEVVMALAEELGVTFQQGKHSFYAEARLKNKLVTLVLPTTYMNLSGKAVQYWLTQLKLTPQQMIVITDDIALDTGVLRMRAKGSHGGHNGLRHIEETLQSQDYPRLRFGVGNHFSPGRQVDFVLGKWKPEEEPLIKEKITKAADAVKAFVLEDIGKAMTKFNG